MGLQDNQTLSELDGAPTPQSLSQETRDPRFAELDAQIQAERAARQRETAAKPKRHRRRPGPALPATVRKEIARFARELKRGHRQLFIADPKLRDRASRFLRSLLPPQRKRGRPGLPSVSKAILLLRKCRREYPHDKPAQLWARIYPEAIPGFASMDRERQKAERLLLRERVRNRVSQRGKDRME